MLHLFSVSPYAAEALLTLHRTGVVPHCARETSGSADGTDDASVIPTFCGTG